MLRRLTLVLAVFTVVETLSMAYVVRAELKPSLDCRRAATVTERLICAHPYAPSEDRLLARAYLETMRSRRTASDRKALAQDQLRWLREVRDRCADGVASLSEDAVRFWFICTADAYQRRVEWLRFLTGMPVVPDRDTPSLPALPSEVVGHYASNDPVGVLWIYRRGADLRAAIFSHKDDFLGGMCFYDGPFKRHHDRLVLEWDRTLLGSSGYTFIAIPGGLRMGEEAIADASDADRATILPRRFGCERHGILDNVWFKTTVTPTQVGWAFEGIKLD